MKLNALNKWQISCSMEFDLDHKNIILTLCNYTNNVKNN